MANPVYNNIGVNYNKYRRADPRITNAIAGLLGLPAGTTVADIGAGTGNYSLALANAGYNVIAIEPSDTMMAQASPHPNVKWAYGVAENIPFADASVDGVVSVLTSHHFTSRKEAIKEMNRICPQGHIVWFTCDHRKSVDVWFKDYFPAIWNHTFNELPPIEEARQTLQEATGRQVEAVVFLLPHDLEDWFMSACWRRPEMYLDPDVRKCTSTFAKMGEDEVREGVEQLREDLDNGAWKQKYGSILDKDTIDWGLRFLLVR